MTVRKIGETSVHSPLKRIALLILAVVFFVSATAFAVPPVMYNVTIYDGNSVTEVLTSKNTADEILADAGIEINEEKADEVSLANFDGKDGSTIIIRRGVKVTIESFDGTKNTVYALGTVKDALEKAEITLKKGTALNYSADTLLEDGMTIEIYDIYKITLTVDGKTITKKVSGKTVEDALSVLGVELKGEDFTEPALNKELKNGMEIAVFRVETKKRTEEEAIPYETEYTYSDSLYRNRTRTLESGKEGTKAIVYEDTYINGELLSSEKKSEKVIENPQRELVQVGTKVNAVTTGLPVGTPISEMAEPSYLKIGANGLPTNYKSVINAQATAYCIPGGITSTGKRAQTGYIAVDPKEIPYGTEMYIVSADGRYVYGYCIAADTGSYIYDVDWTVDLYMNSEAQCRTWGRRDIIIYVL